MVRHSYRFWEIDCLRGFAVGIMLLYHFLYDLDFFGLADIELDSGPLLYLARIGASLFVLISGIALSISHSRALNKSESYREENFPKYLKRGCKLFSMGLLLTLITWIYFPEEYIVFGILHFFGVAALLVYPFLDYKQKNLFFGLFFILIGFYLRGKTFGFSTLVWLGFIPENFTTFDYFPIFPWFGVLLIGVFLGNTMYEYGERQFKFPYTRDNFVLRLLVSAGKHSLFIYFIHQPTFLAFLFLTGLITPASL